MKIKKLGTGVGHIYYMRIELALFIGMLLVSSIPSAERKKNGNINIFTVEKCSCNLKTNTNTQTCHRWAGAI